jgi:hypothetical protein
MSVRNDQRQRQAEETDRTSRGTQADGERLCGPDVQRHTTALPGPGEPTEPLHWFDAGRRATSGIRTHDLTFTKRPLCQLSYGGNGRDYTSRREG